MKFEPGLAVLRASKTLAPIRIVDNHTRGTPFKTAESLRIGVTQAPPWYFKNPAANEWSGLGVSVGSAMAETIGVDLEPVEVTWGTAVSDPQTNQIDLMFVLDATPSRAMAIDFPAQSLLYYALAVLADEDLSIATWDDLNTSDIKIAVTQHDTREPSLPTRLGSVGGCCGKPFASLLILGSSSASPIKGFS
jgi:polar amino acid transport system substrate-binding protein